VIPVFVKLGVNRWEYRGMHRLTRRETNPKIVAAHAVKAGRAGDVSCVLYFERDDVAL
jgi:hypothetical protein